MMKNLLGGYTFIDMRSVETKTSHTIAGLYGEVQKKIAETDKPLMIHNFVYNGESINDTMITNVEEGESDAIVLTIGTSYKLTIAVNSSFTAEAFSTGGSGSSDYDDLTHKPVINGVTLAGSKTSDELKIFSPYEIDFTLSHLAGYTSTDGNPEFAWLNVNYAYDSTDNGNFLLKGLIFAYGDADSINFDKILINRANITCEVIDDGEYYEKRYTIVTPQLSQSMWTIVLSKIIEDGTTTYQGSFRPENTYIQPTEYIAFIDDDDNTWFTITNAQPFGRITYTDPNANACMLHLKKTAGGISVQDATQAVVWEGDHIDWTIPIQDEDADVSYVVLQLTPASTSYTEKLFLVNAHRDNQGQIDVTIKEFPTT